MFKNIYFKKVFNILVYIFAIWGFLLTFVFFAMKLGLTNSNSIIDNQSQYFKNLFDSSKNGMGDRNNVAKEGFDYINSLEEWNVISLGIKKDKTLIERVSKETGLNSRLIITPLVAEQLRLMTSQREIFKRYFSPLGILGSQTQFSLGIYGIKEKTAKQIEVNLKNTDSIYYLGKKYENILDYIDTNSSLLVYADTLEAVKEKDDKNDRETILLSGSDAERIKRLTNEKDHYYSYLYAAIYMKQIIKSWEKAGFDISGRPEIIATLYNIGFENSNPNDNPEVGGADIDLNNKEYSFGSIAFYFYFSDELLETFNR